MPKIFYNSNLGNRNFFKVLEKFLLAHIEILFLHRLYLRNGASWTHQTWDAQYHNFWPSFQIRCQNLKIRKNKLNYQKFLNFFNFFNFLKFFMSTIIFALVSESEVRIWKFEKIQNFSNFLNFFKFLKFFIGTLIFTLVYESEVRISKFAKIKKNFIFFNF